MLENHQRVFKQVLTCGTDRGKLRPVPERQAMSRGYATHDQVCLSECCMIYCWFKNRDKSKFSQEGGGIEPIAKLLNLPRADNLALRKS